MDKRCIQSGVKVDKNKMRIKARLVIIVRASTEPPQMGGHQLGAEILKELKDIKAGQQKIINFQEYQHKWNLIVQGKCEAVKLNISNTLIVHESMFVRTSVTNQQRLKDAKAPLVGQKIQTNATKASIQQVPIQPPKEETEEEEEVTTHLEGGVPLIRHFTTANLNSEEED